MIDIHAHILPHLDDGSASTAVSLQMAKIAVRSGVTDLIATPHSNQRGKYENYASPMLEEQLSRLREKLRQEEIPLRLHQGMEVYATFDLMKLFERGKLLTLAGSRYLLLEFGFYDEPEYMAHVLSRVLAGGLTPIVAHPERYYALQAVPNYVSDWVAAGVHLQINKGSLFGAFGRDARELAIKLLDHGLISFCASDAHRSDRRTPSLAEAYDWIAAHDSEITARRLLRENPERVLANKPLEVCRPIPFR